MSAESRIYSQRNMSGASMARMLNPESDKPVRTKDFQKENLAKMREMQAAKIYQKLEEEKKAPEAFKLERFKSVESVVFQNVDFSAPPPAAEIRIPASMRTVQPAASDYISKKTKKLPSVPTHADVNELAPRVEKNFKSVNAMAAIDTHTQAPPEKAAAKKADYGKVPQYLVDRKRQAEIDEAKRILDEADRDIPPGMIRMSEDERLKTLAMLNENKNKIEDDIRRLPLRIETLSQIERQNVLLEKLKEIEDAIKVFSRSPVYITP